MTLRLKVKNGLGSYDDISASFGFPVPDAFARFVGGLYQYSRSDINRSFSLFARLTGLMFNGVGARYPQTPPELFPIASLGVDGVHYGYVIHAPEIETGDYPVGQLCPMDSEGVIFIGKNTKDTLEHWMTYRAINENDEWQREEVTRLGGLFGLKVRTDLQEKNDDYSIDANEIHSFIASDWHFESTSDGVGVLAPSMTFAQKKAPLIDFYKPNDLLREAEKALTSKFPATALYYLREAFWHNWTEHSVALPILRLMKETYQFLNRQLLVEAVEAKIAKWFLSKRY